MGVSSTSTLWFRPKRSRKPLGIVIWPRSETRIINLSELLTNIFIFYCSETPTVQHKSPRQFAYVVYWAMTVVQKVIMSSTNAGAMSGVPAMWAPRMAKPALAA